MAIHIPFVAVAVGVTGRMGDDKAAIAPHVDAGQHALAGGNVAPGVPQHDMDTTTRRVGPRRGQKAMQTFELVPVLHAGLIDVDDDGADRGPLHQTDAVAANREPVMDLHIVGRRMLISRPADRRQLFARSNRHNRPSERHVGACNAERFRFRTLCAIH